MTKIVRTVVTATLLLSLSTPLSAETVTATGTIESVDAEAGTITVRRKTASGEKTAQFKIANATKIVFNGEISALNRFQPGQKVEITYDTKAKQVTKLQAWAVGGAVAPEGNSSTGATSLIQGDSLDGWQAYGSNDTPKWNVENGVLTNYARGPSLTTKEEFGDFDLHLEFSLPPECNSGVYLRGRYEIQIIDSAVKVQGRPLKPVQRCGAIYGQTAPSRDVYKGANQWNSLDVRVEGKTVTVRMNDVTIIREANLKGVTDGGPYNDESNRGPIALQSHGVTGAKFRNITVTPR